MTGISLPADYPGFLAQLTTRIRQTQVRAALAVNAVLVELYWRIGHEILHQQEQQGWGTKVIDHLAQDLRREFPALTGFSPRNLKYMRAFAKAWPDAEFVQQVVAQIPWGHNVRLLEAVQDPSERAWYAQQTIEHGWSRNVLVAQVESSLYLRQGRAVSNFVHTLPAPQSDLAQQLLKDPYTFDFLALGPAAQERELERGLLAHVRSFLLELGKGFALVGSQYPLEVGGQDYYLDLLFYHLTLRCFVVIDLKMGEFKPEDSGKMNFYLAAADELLRHPSDQPTIGLILCKTHNRVVSEYALRGLSQPIGVAEWQLTRALPPELRRSLPSSDELEAALGATPTAETRGTPLTEE
ncbi:YhcG family protein [Hymenobacter artigasi]|uniref:Nuclease of restriction endonuclease-like (RecB) superfamily n=1 Tax=Hymenobacter artigasi TaxID=2719616 RepID=A0ABX1HNP4_9BACT|nr:PDDEXK nuclease domain-containing protein [Hymenobacter artigasi]NKI91879.1 putative nuclease of restriction endonuclease-like (RecB) superfamily [Hymenobacter artigasi]